MNRLLKSISSLSVWVLQPVLVVLILVVGFVAASQLSLRREPPQRSEAAEYAPLVRTITTTPRSHSVEVHGNGSLEARTRINLVPQVGGEIVEIHQGLREGGRFQAGDVLLRIEARDYELAVARAAADIASAQTGVITTRAESEVAIAEWDRLNAGEPCPPLVALEPQIRDAEARVATADAQLEQARLNLARTRLSLPFDGRVVSASVDVGEVIAGNQPVGIVYATDVFEVAVPLRVEELAWLDLPHGSAEERGASAVIHGEGAGGSVTVTGRVARVYGELDETSRMARVVVEVSAGELDPDVADRLLPGTFVDVEFEGTTLDEVIEIPRGAMRQEGVVWIIENDQLRFARPDIVYRGNGALLVRGLSNGARVVTSNLEVVTDGMRVRIEEESAR